MRKRVLSALLAVVLVLSVFSMATASEATAIVTITNPDGTVIEMSLADYMAMMGYSTSTTPANTETPVEEAPDTVLWPTYNLTKYELKISNPATSKQTYCGPSRNYAEAGNFLTWKLTRTDGLLVEGSYVLVEINYTSTGLRRVYFSRGTFKNTYDVPEVSLVGYPAVTTAKVTAWYGPGPMYNEYPNASVGANTSISVFFEENGYVFAEYEAGFQLVRAWISASSVKPE